jgi:Cortical protein marker for cell polarity
MGLSSLMSLSARVCPKTIRFFVLLTSLIRLSQAINFPPIPSANLDLSKLGRVGLAGDFDGISLYEFQGQNENGANINGSQSILTRFPDGSFATLASADANIKTMCTFIMSDGTMAGIIIGGNFTSLGGIESQGVALFNPNTSAVTALAGLSGEVSALLCDESTNTVYVGGSFKAANSTNAIAWVGTAGWTDMPFNGFNGPITSISKMSNGHILFGGTFTGLGNASAPRSPDQQVINISGGNITAGSSTTTVGFSDPNNIVCKTSGADGPGNTWLLANNTPGFWKAEFSFGFEPTKLRLWNTHQDGRGTKTWRFTALPINGIMNFTYIDPATGLNASCTSECPLLSNTSVLYQDFHFVNVIGMNAFQIDISDWYGSGGGLVGVELFEDDIFAYAISTFNEPSCANIQTASSATTTGPWSTSPSLQSVSEYLSATLAGPTIDPNAASVVFFPDIKQSGNYSVNMYTPGCIQDNTCSSRGQINITVTNANGPKNAGFQTTIFQTNNFDKYDQIYFGYIEASSSSFRPSVTLSPSSGQSGNLTIVAQRVGFSLIASSGGLNSLFEYDPTLIVVNTADFANSVYDQAGLSIQTGGGVKALAASGDTTFVAGNFTAPKFDNIFMVNSSGSGQLSGGGLNSHVMAMFLSGDTLYVGGNFTNTSNSSVPGLNNIGAYDISKNTWSPLGQGVNGRVFDIVPLPMNITGNTPETVIALTGNFDQILEFGNNQSIPVSGFAIWVPSHNNWLQNLGVPTISISGQLSAVVNSSGESIFAGSLSSEDLSANSVVELSSGLSRFPVSIKPSQEQSSSSLRKQNAGSQNVSGVVTGLYYENGGRNVTVLGGHFQATASDGTTINNLVFINGTASDAVTGLSTQLSSDSTVYALAVDKDTLYAGGTLTGTVNDRNISGLVTFNLQTASFDTQPPALTGNSATVYSITVRPNTDDVYVAGSFTMAGSLDCPAICVFSTTDAQWNQPGNNLAGTANTMMWANPNSLIVGGSLTIGGNSTFLAKYNAQNSAWSTFDATNSIPGPVTALAPTSDASQLWAAGIATNGSTFLMMYDGSSWNSVGSTLGPSTTIRGLQVLLLTQNHDPTNLVQAGQTLMLTGSINLPGFGSASAVLFNGTTFQPFALTSSGSYNSGSLSQIFFQQQNFITAPGNSHFYTPSLLRLTKYRWPTCIGLRSVDWTRYRSWTNLLHRCWWCYC